MNYDIEVLQPKPYEKVKNRFSIYGLVSKILVDSSDDALKDKLSLEILDIDGRAIMASVAEIKLDELSEDGKKYRLLADVELSRIVPGFLASSAGRLTIVLSDRFRKSVLFIPVIAEAYEQYESVNGINEDINRKHKNIQETVQRNWKELEEYYDELNQAKKDCENEIGDNQSQWSVDVVIDDENIFKDVIGQMNPSQGFQVKVTDLKKFNGLKEALNKKHETVIEWSHPRYGYGGFGPLTLEVVRLCAELITIWVVKHSIADIDDALWKKFKELINKVLVSAKRKSPERDDIAIIINQGKDKKAIVFIFDKRLSLGEAEDASMKVFATLKSLNEEELSHETYSPVVFKYDRPRGQWTETPPIEY